MRSIAALICLILTSTLMAYAAPAKSIVGDWNCKSVDERGAEVPWTLTVREQEGELSGWIEIGGDRIDLIAPKLEGQNFTFSVAINPEETVSMNVTVKGDKLEGKFSGKTSGKGTITGQKKPA